MKQVRYEHASEKYIISYNNAVDTVAREKKYLAATEGYPLENTLVFVKRIIKNNLAQYYAIDEDKVVGWSDILPGVFEGMKHVGTLGIGILPQYRNIGIGKQLILLAIDHAKNINRIEKVELEVFKSNENAIILYKKLGFEVEGERKKHRKLNGQYDDTVLMAKFI